MISLWNLFSTVSGFSGACMPMPCKQKTKLQPKCSVCCKNMQCVSRALDTFLLLAELLIIRDKEMQFLLILCHFSAGSWFCCTLKYIWVFYARKGDTINEKLFLWLRFGLITRSFGQLTNEHNNKKIYIYIYIQTSVGVPFKVCYLGSRR